MSRLPEEDRGVIAWMARNNVAPNILMLFLVIGGFMVFWNMQREVFPDRSEDLVQIRVPYPGASPEEVEQGVVLSIESGVRGLDGVLEVRSTSREGVGMVLVEALPGIDLDELSQRIKSEVDRIRTLPRDAEEPEISPISSRREVLSLQIFGDVSDTVLRQAAEEVRDELIQDPNITQVELSGDKPFEIAIEVPQENLRRYNLTLDQIAARLRQASVDLPAGGVKTEQGEVLVRMTERRDYGREFARTPIITTDDGNEVLLEDIAIIKDAFAEVDVIGWYNGVPAIGIDVFRVGNQTPMQVASAVEERVDAVRARLPEAIQIAQTRDMAKVYRQRMDLLMKNGIIGGILVMLLLGLFLEARLAFWVMLAIPISFLGGIIFLPILGISLNMMSMFAFILSLGILVDNAIVIGENIYTQYERGKTILRAAIDGARELAVPVTFSVLTNVAAFLPVVFVPGTIGKMFWMLPAVSITVFLVSLVGAIYILPAHLGHAKPPGQRKGLSKHLHAGQQRFSKGFTRAVETLFRPALRVVLSHRYVAMSIALSILFVVLAWPLSKRMGFGLYPTMESDTVYGTLAMPFGHPVADTATIARRMSEAARALADETGHPELIVGISASMGDGGSHTARVRTELAPSEIRDKIMPAEAFVNAWREKTGSVLGADSLIFNAESTGGRIGSDLNIQLSHRDVDVLEAACAMLAEQLSGFPNVLDIDSGFQGGKAQIDFKIKPEGRSMGLTAQDVARQVRNAFYGAEVLRQQRGRNEMRVMVRLPDYQRFSEYNIEQLMLRTPAGGEVPLRSVVDIERGRSFTVINRIDGRRIIEVTANVMPRSEVVNVIAAMQQEELPELLAAYPGLTYRFEGRQAELDRSMAALRKGFALAMCGIFALLAIAFRSYIMPLVVMSCIPFGIIGAIAGHHIMGYSLSMISIFGMVALSGVVINGALVLIHTTLQRREAGESPHDAVLDAAAQRFRPILLTTLTTFCGLAPIMFETSRQAQFLIPMALSLGYGVLFSTFVVLFIVPCLYLVMDDCNQAIALAGRFLRGDFEVATAEEQEA